MKFLSFIHTSWLINPACKVTLITNKIAIYAGSIATPYVIIGKEFPVDKIIESVKMMFMSDLLLEIVSKYVEEK